MVTRLVWDQEQRFDSDIFYQRETALLGCRQAERPSTLTAICVGSNPTTPATRPEVQQICHWSLNIKEQICRMDRS